MLCPNCGGFSIKISADEYECQQCGYVTIEPDLEAVCDSQSLVIQSSD